MVGAGLGQSRFFLLVGSLVGIGLGSFLVLFVRVLYPLFLLNTMIRSSPACSRKK